MDDEEQSALAANIVSAVRSRARPDMDPAELMAIDLMAAVAFDVVKWQAEIMERNPGSKDALTALALGLGEVFVNAAEIFCNLYSIDMLTERQKAGLIRAMEVAIECRFEELEERKPETLQ